LALLIWRLPDFDIRRMFPRLDGSSVLWLVAAGATLLAAFALQTLRWSEVLRALGHRRPFRRLLDQFLAGQFVSNLLPTAFAGDVVRISRTGRDIGSRSVAFASVTLERLTGWLVLPSISLVTLLAVPRYRSLGTATATAVAIATVTIVALVLILVAAGHPRWTETATQATGWRSWLGAVHLGLVALRRAPRLAVGTLVVGVGFQVVQCLAVYLAARALRIDQVTLAAALAFFPVTAIAQNLPIGLGGLGIREGGFVLFFGALGAPHERAIALGLTVYLLTLLTSAVGAPSFVVSGRRAASPGPPVP
jgi:uncharacterized membrane protein YbhN (UPF0104 family)